MTKKFVVTIMLGMNRFSGRDTDHKFDMGFFKNYNKVWLPQISDVEKTCSAPIYEVAKTMDEFITEYNSSNPDKEQIIKEDVYFIIGRGTIGSSSEDHLSEALLQARKSFGKNAYYILYAKSYGVVDTLRAFLPVDMQQFKLDLMFAVDGYALRVSRRDVTKRYKKKTRLIIPKGIKKVYGIVQRKKGFNGFLAGSPSDRRCRNKIVRQKEIDAVQKWYTNYSDGYKRRLKVDHYNMEEIVSTIPCCQAGTNEFTVNDIIKKSCYKYMG